MYSLHNLYIYPGEIESAFYQKQTCRFTLILTQFHTQELHNTSQHFLRTVSFSLLLREKLGVKLLVQGHLELYSYCRIRTSSTGRLKKLYELLATTTHVQRSLAILP